MITKSTLFIFFTCFLIKANCAFPEILPSPLSNIPEDGRLQFCELANKYGYKCIRYNVTTEDGYILALFNIPGDRCRPVLLQHGFIDSADTFLIRTTRSIVAYLAAQGYDIWLGNMRGNKYSRAHVSLNPDIGLKFWNFSFHEIGKYDVPAMIDFVLNKTGQAKLRAIAHSEGTTLYFVMGSIRPEYNDKLIIVICLAPIAYLHNAEQPIVPVISATIGPVLNRAFSLIDYGEVVSNSSKEVELIRAVCSQPVIGYATCAEGVAFLLFGRDREQLEPEFFTLAIGHYPSGSSYKNVNHMQQVIDRRQFAQYDYGSKNVQMYGTSQPPRYNLTKMTARVALVVGMNDRLNDVKDIDTLKNELGNLVDHHVMKSKQWNHIDFVWGRNMTELFVYLGETLSKYCN